MEITAPAKINLFLSVFGKRQDGYHDIGTLFERISIFDRVKVDITSSPTSIEASGADIPTDETSLLGRTINSFRAISGKKENFSVLVEKNIPVAAGMGGGSSDAAALLKGLNALTGKPLSPEKLGGIGARLGADVPFFLKDVSFGLGTERGDAVREVKTDLKLSHLIVNPPLKVETKYVYSGVSGFNLTKDKAWATMLTLFLEEKNITGLSGYLRNDLQQIVLREFPQVGEAVSFLKQLGAKAALMTGSGPTVFGVFDEKDMDRAEEKTRSRFPIEKGWRVYAARTY